MFIEHPVNKTLKKTKTNYLIKFLILLTERPVIVGGLSGMRVLKTTQSAFTDFVQDEYRTLPDAYDRVFSTEVSASWEYSTANGVNFNQVW